MNPRDLIVVGGVGMLLIVLIFSGCATSTRTETFADGRTVVTQTRSADSKALRVLVGSGVEALSRVAAEELARRAQEENNR